jgi:GNAT superfamily N-acetyltransferase
MAENTSVEILPLIAERWQDLETLFGEHGAYAGCWCMFWRLERAEFKKLEGEGAKAMLKGMAEQDEIPGLLAYVDGKPAGWCSVGPRENYRALENSRILKRVDEQPVWSIVCFFVDKAYRKQGIMYELVRGAVAYARSNRAKFVEAYPIDMQSLKLAGQKLSGCSGYMGIATAFRENGFVEISRASETQLIMRYTIN